MLVKEPGTDLYAGRKEYTIFDSFKKSLKSKPQWTHLSDTEKIGLILREVASVFNLPVEKIQSETRKTEIVIPRHMVCYLCWTLTGATLSQIGEIIGDRDHTTVINGRDVIQDMVDTRDDKYYSYWLKYVSCAKDYLVPSTFNLVYRREFEEAMV
jgi:chromosomal replication initiation ATPase DnaA